MNLFRPSNKGRSNENDGRCKVDVRNDVTLGGGCLTMAWRQRAIDEKPTAQVALQEPGTK
jgi:hypothetical protein